VSKKKKLRDALDEAIADLARQWGVSKDDPRVPAIAAEARQHGVFADNLTLPLTLPLTVAAIFGPNPWPLSALPAKPSPPASVVEVKILCERLRTRILDQPIGVDERGRELDRERAAMRALPELKDAWLALPRVGGNAPPLPDFLRCLMWDEDAQRRRNILLLKRERPDVFVYPNVLEFINEIVQCCQHEAEQIVVCAEIEARTPAPPGQKEKTIELVPGGFVYKNAHYKLTGKARRMLESLLNARNFCRSVSDLLDDLETEAAAYPEQVVKGTARDLRAALRIAVQAAGLDCENPLPSTGRGRDLAYQLKMP
jgi:hypothetical protein